MSRGTYFEAGAQQAVEQQVTVVTIGVGRLRHALLEHEHAFQAEPGGGRRRLAGVIGLQRPA